MLSKHSTKSATSPAPCLVLETGFGYLAQDSLELRFLLPQPSTAETTSLYHHTWLVSPFLVLVCADYTLVTVTGTQYSGSFVSPATSGLKDPNSA